jgi:hypothetical protein
MKILYTTVGKTTVPLAFFLVLHNSSPFSERFTALKLLSS